MAEPEGDRGRLDRESIMCFESSRTMLMGIVNVTPDSFSDGGCFLDPTLAVNRCLELVESGADIIDIGGESTRPGSEPVSTAVELERILPVVRALARESEIPISVDTQKPTVAGRCIDEGACIINDIGGLRHAAMIDVIASTGASVIVTHMRGSPATMQVNTEYVDVVHEVAEFLRARAAWAQAAGVREIAVDPGLGFGKSALQNFEILARLREFESLGYPVLIGPSRKSFLGGLSGGLAADERLEGTLAAAAIGAANGAHIIRVHDVKACRRVLDVVDAIADAADAR